ncbi:MAG: hypothetical protein V3T30_05805 [Thermodesulfobacteriota bacterium]
MFRSTRLSTLFVSMLFVLVLLVTARAYAGTVTEEWASVYNGPGSAGDFLFDTQTDSAGNVYVTGYSVNALMLQDMLTIKYDPDGNLLWKRRIKGNKGHGRRIFIDSSGDIYALGTYSLIVPLPPYIHDRKYGLMIVKYDTNGNQLWIWRSSQEVVNGFSFSYIQAMGKVDSSDNLHFAVSTSIPGQSKDITTFKIDSNGNELWHAYYGGSKVTDDSHGKYSDDRATGLDIDSLGNVYTIGKVHNECQPASINCSDTDVAFMKYDPGGNLLWSREVDHTTADSAGSIDVDSTGNVYVSGNMFMAKYDADGNNIWTKEMAPLGVERLVTTHLYSDGSIFARRSTPKKYTTDEFVKYDNNGNELWSVALRPLMPSNISACIITETTLDRNGAFYSVGSCYFRYNIKKETFITKVDPDGTISWVSLSHGFGTGTSRDGYTSIAFDSSNNVFAGGYWYPDKINWMDYLVVKYSQASSNLVPVAHAGAYQNIECTGSSGASVTLDGSGSYDADGDPLTYSWTIDTPVPTVLTGVTPAAVLPLGTWSATLVVNDGTVDSAPTWVDVTVADTTAPTLTLTISPTELIPPDKSMRLITTDAVVTDICDPAVTPHVLTVTSSEATTTPDDINIVGDSVSLRAERDARGDGRIYTITFDAVDGSGNASSAPGTVTVPVQVGPPPVPPIPDNPNLPDPFPGVPGGGRP